MSLQPNVIFIVLDTVRQDRVSWYGYERPTTPAIDSFAQSATVYRDAVAQAPWSIPSHASLFTGKYPHEHGATTISPVLHGEETLADVLSAHGYHTYGVSPNEYVRPLTGFASGFDAFDTPYRFTLPRPLADAVGRGVNYVSRSPRIRQPVELLFNAVRRHSIASAGDSDPSDIDSDSSSDDRWTVERAKARIKAAEHPYFLFVNMMDVHLPRSPEERFREEFVDDALTDVAVPADERIHNLGRDVMTERQMEKMRQLYDADLRSLDHRLGQFLDFLEREGALDDSLVVLVSDHGENLGEFGLIGHQHCVYDSVTSVPLVVRYPGQSRQRIVDEQVEIRRLFHTVLDVTGVREYARQSLERVSECRPAFGEFYTPMMDLDRLVREKRAVYDASLLGTTLSFSRENGFKLIRNVDYESLYRTPEERDSETDIERYASVYDRLARSFPS